MEGDELSAEDLAGVNIPALVTGGLLEVASEAPVSCPACTERKVKKPPHFKKQETLADHYRKEHGGLAVPDIEEV
jgi:hypothetical protein